MHPVGVMHYDSAGNYTAICTADGSDNNPGVADMLADMTCSVSTASDAWAAISSSVLNTAPAGGNYWCVDSTGYTGGASSVLNGECVHT